MKREPIVIREWIGERYPEFTESGPVPEHYRARLDELERLFAAAYESTRGLSTIRRVPSLTRCTSFEMPDGSERIVENRVYEAHYYGPLADIDGEAWAAAVRALGEAAGRWAEELAEGAGIPLVEAVLQERLAPRFDVLQRDWNLFLGWRARGAIMRAPIGEPVAERA